ncbi:helix-turn-helix domain-containing protein [Streptomyces triticirhizae]|uniref:XRE family transcriptional regulator n=1 Tax=Streptomyces triticirhizae TaxID=2483353 RepID=A0A3M2M3B7_9ACTN|nr:helix-turn-helix transcriptional regulator [Streptomyces triticirhizae]RMI43600.1 XRE family transcriptional regulator [Streptomyces triticirhizae]
MNDLEYLGGELREARMKRNLTQRRFSQATGFSQSYVSKVELGVIVPSAEYAKKCDLVLGTDGMFQRMRKRLLERGHPSWFAPYAKMEAEAEEILAYELWSIPGLLQTEEYARALFRAGHPHQSEEWIELRVRNRVARRATLEESNPARLWAIVHEGALHPAVGGRAVMREQLEFLARLTEMPSVKLQVLPFEVGAPPAIQPFWLLELPTGRSVVYTDTALGGQLSEDEERVSSCRRAFDLLRAEALSPRESIGLIQRIAKEVHG